VSPDVYAGGKATHAVWFLVINFANAGQFSKFYYWQIQKKTPMYQS